MASERHECIGKRDDQCSCRPGSGLSLAGEACRGQVAWIHYSARLLMPDDRFSHFLFAAPRSDMFRRPLLSTLRLEVAFGGVRRCCWKEVNVTEPNLCCTAVFPV